MTAKRLPAHPPRPPICDWHSVDWGKRNREIAAHLGCNVQTVSNWRKKLAPDTAWRRIDITRIDWGRSNKEIAREIGCNAGSLSRIRSIIGKNLHRRNHLRKDPQS